MQTRRLGRINRQVGAIGLGTWQLGADWGEVSEDDALLTLNAALDAGVTFLDTADVYGDGRSERVIGRLLRERVGEDIFVATKMCRRADPFTVESMTADAFRAWTDRSRENLGVDILDLVQLHCPPTPLYEVDAVFETLDEMVGEGRMREYGVSVETCAEALRAIARPHVASVQIILNAFRRKPLEEVLPAAIAADVAIIARVPLASGLLSGRYDVHTTFSADDHRTYNRTGAAFDVGETFAGVPFEVGVRAAQDIARIASGPGAKGPGTEARASTAAFALRWILDQPGVSVVIPGARNAAQARANAEAAAEPPLTPQELDQVREVYDQQIRAHVQDRW